MKVTYVLKIVLTSIMCLNFSYIFGQFNHLKCGGSFEDTTNTIKSMSCTNTSSSYIQEYRLQDSFIPYTSNFVDEVVIPINLIVLADGDGTKGAYTPQEWENEDKEQIHSWLNRAYSNTQAPSDPVSGFSSSYWLNDTKIRFEINEVYFYFDSLMFNSLYPTGINMLRAHHLLENSEAINYINCYLLKNHYDTTYAAGGWTNPGTNNQEPHIVSYGWNDPNGPGHWVGGY